MERKLLSMIVPCYNEEQVLPLFYEETKKEFDQLDVNYELILVDDGSKDMTLSIMRDLASRDVKVKYISFSRNFGKEAAMLAGLKMSKGDYVGFMDADLQHPPALVKTMLSAFNDSEIDCVACKRKDRKGDKKVRTAFSRTFYRIINKVSEVEMQDGAGDFRIMNKKMKDSLMNLTEHNRFSKGLFSWVGYNTYWIEYDNVNRAAGDTSWSFKKLVKYAYNGILTFSEFPLRIPSCFGVLNIILSLVYFVILLINHISNGSEFLGWYLVIIILLLLSGILFISLGIMGRYIYYILQETKNRPNYIVRESNIKN